MSELPRSLKLEVKTSRSGNVSLDARDLEGIEPDGFVVALLNDRRYHGPRWVLAPVRVLSPGTHSESDLNSLADSSLLAEKLNQGWSDWVLDEDSRERILQDGARQVAEKIEWCRREHPPRMSRLKGNVREAKLHQALAEFRSSIDDAATGETGPQIEGQIHQALLVDVLREMGYDASSNPVGVPDIKARFLRVSEPVDLRGRVEAWSPEGERLVRVRRELLELDAGEISEVAGALNSAARVHLIESAEKRDG